MGDDLAVVALGLICSCAAHPLLKRLGKEELSRIARSVADLGQGGKFTLKKVMLQAFHLLSELDRASIVNWTQTMR